ncbi:MAG: hypothetical protein HY452_02445 [Parcubacteria group bacterium]|uniref:Uncharacterized protein n=1 Tax=Candidatus Sungiibacteriota bacterium TaxID=2750080 RepID=A0A931YD39_9BACT|nr:hypothetical protein [Candidatus Sungbacteria bacterium]MBI4119099.1 hypothetical protein [Parcubacteria group bacterium]
MKNKKQKNRINDNQELRRLGVLIEHVDSNVGLIAEQHGDIKKTLNMHTEMIGKLVVDIEIVKSDIEFIKHSFKKKVDIDEFAALERRVLILEKRR